MEFANKKGSAVEIFATSGALLGPPWQAKENGYLIRGKAKQGNKYDLYYEPHCMYDEAELAAFEAEVIIDESPTTYIIPRSVTCTPEDSVSSLCTL